MPKVVKDPLENWDKRILAALANRRRPLFVPGVYVYHWLLIECRLKRIGNQKQCETQWLCRCSCGKERWVYAEYLKQDESKSCGHILRPNLNLLSLTGGTGTGPMMRFSSTGRRPLGTLSRSSVRREPLDCNACADTPDGCAPSPG